MAQYEGTITELSQDVSGLTRNVQRLREDKSALESSLEALRADLEAQQVRTPQDLHELNRVHFARLLMMSWFTKI